MFNFFKKKSEVEKLQEKYEALMKEYHRLSHIDRALSSEKYAEAEAVADEIEKLNKK